MRKLKGVLVAAFLAPAGSQAIAQGTPVQLSAIRDIAPLQGYGQAKVDVIGIRFGEARADAIAILQKAYPAAQVREQTLELALKDNRGNQVAARYEHGAAMNWSGPETNETISVGFTSALTGSRVYAINRDVHYQPGHLGDMNALRAGIREKYGEPTLVERYDHQGRIEITYTWEKRLVKRFEEQDVQRRSFSAPNPININRCLGIAGFDTYFGVNYRTFPANQRRGEPDTDVCIGGLKFVIFLGNNAQTVSRIKIEATDYDRAMTDARLLDQTLSQMLEEKSKSVQGTGRPKL